MSRRQPKYCSTCGEELVTRGDGKRVCVNPRCPFSERTVSDRESR